MNSYTELIKNFTKEDLTGKVNLHLHTFFSDGKKSPEEFVKTAKEKGYKFISITDHNTIDAYLKTDILQEEIVIPGVEFDCWEGTVFLHMLGYGIDVNNSELHSICAKSKKETEADIVRIFSRRRAKDVINIIHKAGGIAVLAHPACCFTLSHERFIKKLVNFGLDGLEVYYPYPRHRAFVKFNTANNMEKLAERFNLIKTGGTDCHSMI